MTPLLLRSLGTVKFGTYSLLGAAAGYLSLLELGLGTAAITRIATAEVEGPEALTDVTSTAGVMFTCVGLGAILVSAAVSVLIPSLFSIPHSLSRQATIAFLFIGAAQGVASMVVAFSSFLLGTGRMYQLNLVGFATSTAISVATVALAVAGASLSVLGAVQFVGAFVMLIALRSTTRRAFPGIRPRWRRARRATMRRMLSLGWRNALSSVAGILAFGSDLVLVGLLLTPRAVAAYAIALKGYGFISRFTNSATGAIGPSHSHQAALGDTARRFEMFCMTLLLTLTLAVVASLTVGFYAHGLLHLWLGRVPGKSAAIVTIFCAVLVLQAPGFTAASLLINSERASDVMRITLASASLNVITSVLMTIEAGVIGPALGSLVAVTLIDLVFFPRKVCRILEQPYSLMFKLAVRPLLVPTCALLIALALGRVLASSGVIILPLIAGAIAVYAVVLWHTPATRQLRGRLRNV